MRLKWWLSLSLLLLAMGSVGWIYYRAQRSRDLADPARARQQGRPIPVRTSLVAKTEAVQVIGGTAVTVASETALIQIAPLRAKAQDPVPEAVVKTVHVQDGDYVRADQLLFEIDDEVLLQIARQREVELTAAEGVLRARLEKLGYEEKLHAMAVELDASGLVSKAQLLEARSRLATARFDVDEARSRVAVLRTDLEVARREVERCRIWSPVEGFVSQVVVVPGTVITAPTVLAQVLKLDPLHVLMNFPQEQLPKVFVGQQAQVVLDSFPQETFTGSVVRIMPEVKTELRVLPVLISLPNPRYRLKPGITGFARLRVGATVTSVPATAIVQQGGKAAVFRVEQGRARLREIRLGPALENGWREVERGLSPGDEVVIFHNFYRRAGKLTEEESYLRDNDPVDSDWRKWARRD